MHDLLIQTAAHVEATGARMAMQGKEPAYHNRLHTADTVVSMACLLRATRQLSGRASKPLSKQDSLCLLTMLLHDYGHEGLINASKGCNEHQSVFLYTPVMQTMGLNPQDLAQVNAMVLNTDPASLNELHRLFKPQLSSAGQFGLEEMTILVTEADVLASALTYPGLQLTESLILEWAEPYPEKSLFLSTSEGRLAFLDSGVHFSSNASKALGIPQMVALQKQLLRGKMTHHSLRTSH